MELPQVVDPTEATERAIAAVRAEYTSLPRFGFHQPLDYLRATLPPDFEDPVTVEGELLPLPPIKERMGYAADNGVYLDWGRYDHDLIMDEIERAIWRRSEISILDFGCSSGRVLRHFYEQARCQRWKLYGADVQARPIEWLRQHFPKDFCVVTNSTLPRLPFADASLDVIYGISVFTHLKYQWDMWLLELRRVLRPGGLMIQTVHTETAWEYCRRENQMAWAGKEVPFGGGAMTADYLFHGDIALSQTFWKKDAIRRDWGRYFDITDIKPPPRFSYQDWVICRRPA